MNRFEVATGPSQTVRSIAEFAVRLRESAPAECVVIDVAELSDVDLSFVQLVEVARRDALLTGKTIQLSAPAPERLKSLLERCGYVASATPDDLAFWFQGEIVQ